MMEPFLSFIGLAELFGVHFAVTLAHDKLVHFLNSRKLSNYDLLECLREAYDLALNSLWDDYSPLEEPENVPKGKMQEYLRLARIDRDKAEECLQRLKGCKDQVFPSPGKGTKKTPFTDKEIRHLVTNANGEEERERIMGIVSPVLDVCGAPETFKNLVEDLEVGLCFRIIFYLKGKIKTDEKVRSILFFELLIDLGCTQEQIRKSVEEIKDYVSGQGLPIWTDLDEWLKQLELTIHEEGEKTRKHADERIGIAEEKIIKEVRKVRVTPPGYEFEAPLSDFSIRKQLDFGKKNWNEPMFFRPMGPVAVDFEDNRVAPRDEIVSQLMEDLKERNLVIAGEPASGKSIILRWVGYRLFCVNNSNVFYVPLKGRRYPGIQEIIELKESAYLLIDDGHLDPEFVRDILFPPSENVRILVATRAQQKLPEMEIFLPGRLKDWQDEAIKIKPVKAIDSIIHTFESHPENNLSIPEDIKIQMKSKYGVNLWLFSWALETYRGKKSIEEIDILEKMKKWLVEDYKDGLRSEDRDKVKDFARIILLLSTFYQYEISVDREFVNRFLAETETGIDDQIEILLRACTIAGDQTSVALHHSELAKTFLKAASRFSNERLYRDIRPHIQPENLFSCYLKGFPQYGCDLLSKKIPGDTEEGGSLIRFLAVENKEEILEAIHLEKDVEKIGECVCNIAKASEEVARRIVEADGFDKQSLIQKLNEEKDLEKMAWCVVIIASTSKEVARQIMEAHTFDTDGLILKLNEERSVEKIGGVMEAALYANKKVARNIVGADGFDKEGLIQKLNKEKDAEEIARCVKYITFASKEVARKILEADAFDKEGLIQKLNEEEYAKRIGEYVRNLAKASKKVARQIVKAETFDRQGLIQKLNEEKDVKEIGLCVWRIAYASKEVAQQILEGLRLEVRAFIKRRFPLLFED